MIHIDSLNFSYEKKTNLFEGLQCSIAPGNIYGLLGKNGAGKTSLLKLLAGTLYPKAGNMEVLGYNPVKREPGMLKEVFFVTEEFDLPPISGKEYVALYSSLYPRFNHDLLNSCLKEFEIDLGEKLNRMSYGQKKKFLLSFGLATDCRILFLDEPTNGLDIPSKSQFRKLVAASLTDERTFVISTHQVRDMEHLIDPVIILDSGRIIFQETMENVAKNISLEHFQEEPAGEGVLYCEKAMGRYITLVKNSGEKESQIDLELLFSAVINNKDEIQRLFSKEGK